jgi:prepilin-type N-terminal cleavage/methylation domain-containing protein/uncharacterized repeat protein (TIGR02543 family)
MKTKISAFTLIEMLATMAIIAILVTVAVPTILHNAEKARLEDAVSRTSVIDQAKINYLKKYGQSAQAAWDSIDNSGGTASQINQQKIQTLINSGFLPQNFDLSKYSNSVTVGSLTGLTTMKDEAGNVVSGPGTNAAALSIQSVPSGIGATLQLPGNYTKGSVVSIQAVAPNAGYTFSHWSLGANSAGTFANANSATTTYTMDNSSSSQTIVANFTANSNVSYTLGLNATTGGTVSAGGSNPYGPGSSVAITATPASGYKFTGWTGDVSSVANVNSASTTVTVNGNYNIKANFQLATYSVAVSVNSAAMGIASGGGNVVGNATVQLNAQPKDGRLYHFVNWTGGPVNGSTSATPSAFTVSGNTAVQANFAANTSHSLTTAINADDGADTTGSSVTPSGTTANLYQYDTVRVNASTGTNTNLIFSHWAPSDDSAVVGDIYSPSTTFMMPDANVTLTAFFKKRYATPPPTNALATNPVSNPGSQTYTITTVANPSGAASTYPPSAAIAVGSSYPLYGDFAHTMAANNYVFNGWYVGTNLLSTSINYTVTPTGNTTYTAKYTYSPPYVISTWANTQDGGYADTPSPGSTSISEGSSVTLNADPSGTMAGNGYAFVGWYNSANQQVSAGTIYSFTPSASGSYEARYQRNKFTVTAIASPAVTTPSPSSAYVLVGSQVTLDANENGADDNGAAFIGWYDASGSTQLTTGTQLTVTVNGNVTYMAKYQPMPSNPFAHYTPRTQHGAWNGVTGWGDRTGHGNNGAWWINGGSGYCQWWGNVDGKNYGHFYSMGMGCNGWPYFGDDNYNKTYWAVCVDATGPIYRSILQNGATWSNNGNLTMVDQWWGGPYGVAAWIPSNKFNSEYNRYNNRQWVVCGLAYNPGPHGVIAWRNRTYNLNQNKWNYLGGYWQWVGWQWDWCTWFSAWGDPRIRFGSYVENAAISSYAQCDIVEMGVYDRNLWDSGDWNQLCDYIQYKYHGAVNTHY